MYDLNKKKRKSINEDNVFTLILREISTTYYIELQVNEDLIEVPVHTKDDFFELNGSDRPCHFHGKIISQPRGFAAISACTEDGKMVIYVKRH